MSDGQISADEGSSPLTRGKLTVTMRAGTPGGLIPAHAGKTPRSHEVSHPAWAHPRSRGENETDRVGVSWSAGSSPLTRGKLDHVIPISQEPGLIPAHAGKTRSADIDQVGCRAHPRSRGENRRAAVLPRNRGGSSPLTRGKPRARATTALSARLIPAHAGKTKSCGISLRAPPAHPRSRGENISASSAAVSMVGSSPLTRGKHAHPRRRQNVQRLIPAHAGKTDQGIPVQIVTPAHPRSRGENLILLAALSRRSGSSPLTRGKLERLRGDGLGGGLIPAHAGKTSG